MEHAALLLMMTEVAEEHDEAFSEWYNNEHIPEILSLPGVLSAERYRVVGEGIRYLALYRLSNSGVPNSKAFLKWRENSESTALWSSRFVSRERFVYDLILAAP